MVAQLCHTIHCGIDAMQPSLLTDAATHGRVTRTCVVAWHIAQMQLKHVPKTNEEANLTLRRDYPSQAFGIAVHRGAHEASHINPHSD